MVAVAVTFDGTRLNDSDANTGWGNFQPSTGGAPSSEGANAYQISTGAAANTGVVGRQSQSTTGRRGIDYNGTSVDYTAAANRLWYLKGYVTDAFDLNTTWGVEAAMGSSDTNNDHRYNIAGSGANLSVYSQYPAQGGYLITCIDPTIDTWRETENGTLDQTAIVWYAFGAQMINGNSKSENVALDAIDYGTGLTLLNGTGADAAGKYTDFVTEDQDDVNNRWGAAIGSGDSAILRGVMTIGASGTATEFDDSTSVVTFPDGYHSRGLFGVDMNIENASSVIADGALLLGIGTRNGVDANDTRPDYTVTGSSGSYTFTGVMRNFRDVTFTSVCDVSGEIECHLLVQGSANIENAIIKCNALTSVACLQDPTFGATTDLNNTEFIQTGAGHAIEIDATGTYDFTNLFFTGFGADTTDSAAIDVTTTAAVVINVVGGDTPTFKTAGTGNVTINNAVTVIVNGVAEGTSVKCIANETAGTVTKGDVLDESLADSTGQVSWSIDYEGAFGAGLDILIRARNQGLCNAAIADDNGSYTDETTESNTATDGDMQLLPTTPVVTEDSYLYGHSETYGRVKVNVSTAGTGTYAIAWEYWNGQDWMVLDGDVVGSDDFEVDTLATDWENGPGWYNDCQITSGQLEAAATSSNSTIRRTAETYDADQWSEGVLATDLGSGGSEFAFVFLGIGTPTATAYYAFCNGTGSNAVIQLRRHNGSGGFTQIGTQYSQAGDFSTGDVIRIVRIGTEFWIYYNGAVVVNETDATYSGGQPGIGCPSESPTSPKWESWSAGNVLQGSETNDGTNGYQTAGTNIVEWTVPSDWTTTTINSQGPFYYVRSRFVTGSVTVTPLGRGATLDVTRYLPIPPTGELVRTITSDGLTATLSQAVDSIAKFDPND